jgi:Cdc6-like AAA superfamily ATPase
MSSLGIKINPFSPHSPVPPGLFVGRVSELTRIDGALFQTRSGRSSNVLLTGERGIGKTSLLQYTSLAASGKLPIEGVRLNFLVVDIDITPKTTAFTFIKRLEADLRRELGSTEKARSFLNEAWSFIRRWEAAGVSYSPEESERNEEIIVDEFAASLAKTVDRITQASGDLETFSAKKDGVLVLIDEADNASDELSIGSLLKLLSERLSRNGCNKVMFLVAGLPEVKQSLLRSHQSSLRIFDDIVLGRLPSSDVNSIIDICLDEAKRENGVTYSITDTARTMLTNFSEGYPHFIQQFGFCAFARDSDAVIDDSDVSFGAFGKGGALEQIGERYYRDDFYNKIQKDSYRQVLRIMAERLDDWITKEEIKKKYSGKPAILDNAIKALRDRHIIIPKEGEKGVYRLQHKGFALWISLYTRGPNQLPLSTEITE